MKKNTVCVLGALSFIGSHLIKALLEQGYTVHAFSRQPLPTSMQNIPRLHFFQGDFFNKKDILQAISGCDICFHLIWTTIPATSNENILQDAQENILGTLQLLECLKEAKVSKLIFTSSAGTVYGQSQGQYLEESHITNPICAYGVSKLAVEKYLEVYAMLYGMNYACLRIANPYGPGQEKNAQQGVIGVFLSKVMYDIPLCIWGDGSVVRDFIYIDDVIRALMCSAKSHKSRFLVNIGSGKGSSLTEILLIIGQITGKSPMVHYENVRKCDVKHSVISIQKAEKILDWHPQVNIVEGIERMYKYLLKQNT